MAENGSFNTGGYGGRYFEFNWWIVDKNSAENWIKIGWNLIARAGNVTWYYTKNITVNIDGEQVFYAGSGKTKCYKNETFASGEKVLGDASGRTFSASTSGDIYTYGTNNAAKSDSWTLPTLAVSPTLPTAISVSGNSGSWVNKDDPRINVSWSGATKGTYTISRYSIDVAKYGTGNYINVGNVYTDATSGSISNESLSEMGTLSGGTSLQVRVGMQTSDNNWWGHTYWGGTLNVYSSPSAPTTFSSSPTSVEIDHGFSLTWSGASAGSNGIAGYDMQARAYNGSSWTGWVDIFSCQNQSSYSVSSIKNLTINGVNYATYGVVVKFQYRIRTSDGKIATSGWKNSNEISMYINSPTTPRKPYN